MKNILIIFLFLISAVSCSTTFLFKEKVTIDELLKSKEQIDTTVNPAKSFLLRNSLSEKILIMQDIKVKDIVPSTNVDYNFCVISDVQTDRGIIELYIYTKNVRRISMLKKGESIINVKGEFSRFFSMLDSYYTKIEIINSIIEIK
ncbi:MAG TPA: hypothetical protein PK906_06560 [Spirochaetota bacterium]|nr:hypothetical protein [Spirochaetota bacterium]